MSKIISTKKINACFLAIVLIAGTLAAISPSFMIGVNAQAEPYGMDQQKYNTYEPDDGMDNSYDNKQSYGKDSNSYDKSKDSSTIVKKIKCNNINVNVNGFNGIEVGTLPTALNGLATEAQASEDEGKIGASSSGSGSGSNSIDEQSDSNTNSRFVCIDNNDFTVVEEEEPISPIPPGPTPEEDCADCFATILDGPVFDQLEAELGDIGGIIIPIGPGISIEINSLLEFCEIVEALGLTGQDLRFFVVDLLAFAGITITVDEQTELVECISDALFPDSINGLG